MKGYIFIEEKFIKAGGSIDFILESDSFRTSNYQVRLDIGKLRYQAVAASISDGTFSMASDPLMSFVSKSIALGILPTEYIFDEKQVEYSDVDKIPSKIKRSSRVNADEVRNSIFCLEAEAGLRSSHGVYVILPTDPKIKQPKNKIVEATAHETDRSKHIKYEWKTMLAQDSWNALVISDRFILRDSESINGNLIKIIEAGISKFASIQITILTEFTNMCADASTIISDYLKSKHIEDRVAVEYIDVRFPKYELHDRHILTNHLYYHVLAGMDLLTLSGLALKNTTLIGYQLPAFVDTASEDFTNFCNTTKARIDNCKERRPAGSSMKNRLLYD